MYKREDQFSYQVKSHGAHLGEYFGAFIEAMSALD
jgi:hypothetical protein